MTVEITEAVSIHGLHTTVTFPGTTPRGVLIVRTPYDAQAHAAEAREWASRGIVVVSQDVRGRYRSPGRFQPFENEGTDGLATLDWVLRQSWCSGPVFLYGTSYGAHCAVETAIAASKAGFDDIAGVSVAVPALGLGETARNSDGCFYLESRAGWWLEHGEGAESPGTVIPEGVLSTLPVADIGRRVDPPITQWSRILGATRTDRQRADQVSKVRCPLLAVGGTADWFAQDTIDLWSSWGGPAALILGPWDHSLRGSGRAGRMQSWIAGVLSGEPMTGAHVHGLPQTVELRRWPDRLSSYVLPGGRFRSDPTDPFPSMPPGGDLRPLANRPDCLARAVPADVGTILGTPTVRVRCAAPSGHWSAVLAIRRRDGRLEQIAHGSSPHPAVRLTPVVAHLDTGESMVVILSAHAFPRHARDLQAGEDILAGTTTRTVRRDVDAVVVELPA